MGLIFRSRQNSFGCRLSLPWKQYGDQLLWYRPLPRPQAYPLSERLHSTHPLHASSQIQSLLWPVQPIRNPVPASG